MKIYYVLIKNGVPVDVTTYEWHARKLLEEATVPGAKLEIVPVTPLQEELPLKEPEPKLDPALDYPEHPISDLSCI